MRLSLCIVGCGGYARKVMGYTRDVAGDFRFYFASRDPDKARLYAETYGGAGHFGSYEEAAASPDVEAMYFLTPHYLHLEHALLAAAYGKHVLMEKPIGRTIEEARQMAGAARDAGTGLMVAENYRFLPTIIRAKELMALGYVGNLRSVNVIGDWAGVPGGWRTSLEMSGGGSFIDGGIHLVDALVNLGGMPESLYAAAPPKVLGKDGEDGMAVVAHLPGGAVGTISYSNGTPRSRPKVEIVMAGTKETLTFDPFGETIERESLEGRTTEPVKGGTGSSAMLLEFRASIFEDREPAMSAEEGINDLSVVLAAYRSVERGWPISLS